MNTITQAFVLAAGRGTRLRPLTEDLPKPLIPIFQKPLITFALDHLIDAGLERFVINTHKQAELFETSFCDNEYQGHSVTLVHEPDLLETGGGIKNAERYFANVAVWNSDVFQQIPTQRKISFIPIVADWIGKGGKIGGLVMNDGKWFNIGSRAEYLDVHRTIIRERWTPYYVRTRDWPERVAKSAIVDSSAQVRGCSIVGENCQVGAGAILEDTILWAGAQIASKSQLHRCIVRSQKKVSGIHRDSDI